MKLFPTLAAIVVTSLSLGPVKAQILPPAAMSYQGFLTDSAGVAITATKSVRIRLYDAESSGDQLWERTYPSVQIDDGGFALTLDAGAPAFGLVPFDQPVWIEMRVVTDGETLTPRTPLRITPYAQSLRHLRVIPKDGTGPSIIGGWGGNSVGPTTTAATISGGGAPASENAVTSHYGTVGGGLANSAGFAGTVPGGFNNIAASYSFAAGSNARAIHDGSFVFSDRSNLGDSVTTESTNQFLIRAANGVGIGTSTTPSPLTVAGRIESTSGGFKFPDGTTQTTASSSSPGWGLTGQAGTTAGTNFVGTTDSVALEIKVNNSRVMRFEPDSESPNLIGGSNLNSITANIEGATIAGGGKTTGGKNEVTGDFGTIGGGYNNEADTLATVGGGRRNNAWGEMSTIGGGYFNSAERLGTVGGGNSNSTNGVAGTVAGGVGNYTNGHYASVGGGANNGARGDFSVIGGGYINQTLTSGSYSTVPGGYWNEASGSHSFAAGSRAIAAHTGTFVWSDSATTLFDEFESTGAGQFLIRARGGVGIGTAIPLTQMHVQTLNNDLPSGAIVNDDLVVESSDAVAGLYSSAGGSWGSALVLGAVTGGGANFDKWALARQGTLSGKFHITYTANGGYTGSGGRIPLTIASDGKVGLEQTSPAHPLHVGHNALSGNGAHVTVGGVWTNGSSRTFKHRFEEVDTREILETVAGLPTTRWEYHGEDGIKHLGPIAEDFYEAFELGGDERYIGTVDADGVALAAIKGLYDLVKAQSAEIDRLKARLDGLD